MGLDVNQAAKLCALVGCVLFCNSLGLQFCLDDDAAILKNPDLLQNASWFNLLKNDFWGKPMQSAESHKSYRPLTVATFRLNYMLHELQPLGYHLVNVLLHSAVCYLYVLLCGVVFGEVWPALIAGLLFAVHPIHTEAVSGLVGRADVMCALFTLAALFCYRKSLEVRHNALTLLWFVMMLLSTLCGALCKEIGITSTALCLTYEMVLHRKVQVGIRTPAKKLKAEIGQDSHSLPAFWARAAILGLFSISFIWMRLTLNQGPPSFHIDNNPALDFPTPLRQLHWSYLCVLNVWLLLSPSQLCAEYAMGTIPPIASLTDPRNLLTLATFAGLLSVGCYAASTRDSHHRKLLFGVCLMVIPFIPASNLFFPVGFVIAERVLYIPSMGFSMIVAYGAWLLISNTTHTNKSLTKTLIVFLLCTQSLKTYTRNYDWEDNLTLFSSALKVSKTSAKMWNFVANTHFKTGNYSMAKPLFRKAIEVEPLYVPAHINLVRIMKKMEEFNEAIEHASRASELAIMGINGENPHFYQKDRKVFLELARLLLVYTNRYEEAYLWSERAVEQMPDWEAAYVIMGRALIKLGRHSEAVGALNKALELKEDFAEVHASLGEAHLELGELEEAEMYLRRASELNSQDFLSQYKLVKLIFDHTAALTTSRLTEALNVALDLLLLEPENGNLTKTVALLYEKLGNRSQALQYLDRTIAITPSDSSVYLTKAKLYTYMQRYAEAEETYAECERQAPNDVDRMLFVRGTNYLHMREFEKSHTYLAAALAHSPDHEPTLINYGIALLHTNDYEKALELFRKLVRDHPDNTSYSDQLSLLERQMGLKS